MTSPVRQALSPVADFLRDEVAGGVVLLAAAVVALVWANSPLRGGLALLGDRVSDGVKILMLAIAVALVLGKLLGISAAVLGGVRARVGTLPAGVSRRSVWGVAALGGIGFTVSLFIAGLAFDSQALQDEAKIAIFAGSITGGALGALVLVTQGRASPSQ